MLSRSCVRLSLASQLQRIGFLAVLTGWIAGPAFERGNEVYKSAPTPCTRRSGIAGFSMVELAVSMAVLLILTGIAIPSLMRSFRTYQLNDAAARLSDMLKFTRFEAVRRNKPINFLMQSSGTGWLVGTDSNVSGTIDPTDKRQLIAGFPTLLPAGVAPPPNAITPALRGAALTQKSGSAGCITIYATVADP